MILILNKSGRILAFNTSRPKESVDPEKGEVWYDGEFCFSIEKSIEGKRRVYYYEEGEIRIEYVDIPESVEANPTQLDRIEAKLDYTSMLQEG